MKVRIDKEMCQGHGHCITVCPDVFESDEEGFGVVKNENVPEHAEADCRRAEANCPERAIHIERN